MPEPLDLGPREAELARCFDRVFNCADGEIVLAQLARICGVLEADFIGPERELWRAGKRAVYLELLSILRRSEGELLALARRRTTQELLRERGGDHGHEYFAGVEVR